MIFTVVLPNVSVSIFEHAFCKSLICITHNPPHQVPDIMPIDSYGYNIQFLIVIIAIIMTHLVPQTIGTVYPLKNTHTHLPKQMKHVHSSSLKVCPIHFHPALVSEPLHFCCQRTVPWRSDRLKRSTQQHTETA